MFIFLLFTCVTRIFATPCYFVDKSAGIKGAQIISGEYDQQFRPTDNKTLNLGVTTSAVWLRYTVSTDEPSRWLLSLDNPSLDYITYYHKAANGQWNIHQTGDLRPFASRMFPYRNFVFPVSLQETYYVRVASTGVMQMKLSLQKEEDLFSRQLLSELGYGVYLGLMLLLLLFNFRLSPLILSNILLTVVISGHLRLYIPYATNITIAVLTSCVAISICICSYHNKMTLGIIGLLAANIVASFFIPISISISIAGVLAIFPCVTDMIKSRNKFVLFAWGVLCFSVLLSTLSNAGWISYNALLVNSVTFLSIAFVLYALTRSEDTHEQEKEDFLAAELLQLQQSNIALEQQVAERTIRLQQSLHELSNTKTKLLQKEKISSLGELTFDIANEIQHPINFVTNFTELTSELVDQLTNRLANTDMLLLTDNLKSNLSKISHHGHRADAIVKGMLSHSRISKGEKRTISLNALVEESLQRVKTADVIINKQFDHSIPSVECNPSELESVLASIYKNAFYAMRQKRGVYQQELSVMTKNTGQWIEIVIHDNGTGIDPISVSKIFQPFFTTKPADQGTGLGLSLSYDIIVKSLDGELTVRSEENVFTELTIRLPK